jgi:hypothetical protein
MTNRSASTTCRPQRQPLMSRLASTPRRPERQLMMSRLARLPTGQSATS